MHECTRVHTFELIPGVKDTHVCWDGVKPTTSYDVHAFLSCLTVVIQLHALQKLYTTHVVDMKAQNSAHQKGHVIFEMQP